MTSVKKKVLLSIMSAIVVLFAVLAIVAMSSESKKVSADATPALRSVIETENVKARSGGTESAHGTDPWADDCYGDIIFYTVSVTNGTVDGETSAEVRAGDSVTVTANSAPTGNFFSCWKDGSGDFVSGDNPYTFTVTEDIMLTAYFTNLVTVTATGGTVNGETSVSVVRGSTVNLVANSPATGYYFINWTDGEDNVVATASAASVEVVGATDYTANFLPYTGKKYASGSSYSVMADSSAKYKIVSFDYKISSGTKVGFCLLSDFSNYYGYFEINASGLKSSYDGVEAIILSDGYINVTITVEDITEIRGTPSSYDIDRIYISSSSGKTDADVYLRNVSFTSGSFFTMTEGASVRMNSPYGIRFRSVMSYDVYKANKDNTFGMIILPYDYITANEIALTGDIKAQLDAKSIKYREFNCIPVKMASPEYYIQGSLTNILSKNLTREFFGIGYIYDGENYTYAALNSIDDYAAHRRAIKTVAESAIVKNYDGFAGYTSVQQEFLLEMTSSSSAAGAAFTANAFDSIENFKKSDVVSTSGTLSLSAAKGESEFGQIVLTATSTVAGKPYVIVASDLTHSDGFTKLSKSNFDLFNAWYTKADDIWACMDSTDSHYASGYSYATTLPTGYFVNALVPFYAASVNAESVFDRTNGDNQTIIIRFNIPEDQKAGTYTGIFRVYTIGVGYKDVSVSFTVNNFVMPDNNYVIKMGIDTSNIASMFSTNNRECSTEEYAELYELLLEYNVSAGEIPSRSVYYGDIYWEDYLAKLVECYNDPRVSAIQLGSIKRDAHYEYKKASYSQTKTYDNLSVICEDDCVISEKVTGYGTKTVLTKIARYCVDNNINLFEKLYYRGVDEPSTPAACITAILSYNAVKNGVAYALSTVDFTGHEDIEASLRALPYFVTAYPSKQIKDDYSVTVLALGSNNRFVDNVYSQTAYYCADEYNGRQDITINRKYLTDYIPTFDKVIGSDTDSRATTIRTDADPNTHLWWYSMVQTPNPYPNYALNADGVINRSKTWAAYYYGVEGELFWAVNDWKERIFNPANSWTEVTTKQSESEIWSGTCVYFGCVEDGTLVYPNVTRYSGDFRYCATYRLVTTKEGIDDYNYICYAQSLIDQMAEGASKTEKQTTLDTIVDNMVNENSARAIINNNAATLRTNRAALVTLIEELQG